MQARHLSEIELTELADGEMHPARLGAAVEHVSQCPACAHALAAIQEATLAVGGLKQVAGPADLRTRVAKGLIAAPADRLSCEEAAPLLHEYIDGCLSPAAAVPLQHHLDACPTCRAELAAFASASRLVRLLPEAASPARVREAVAAEQRRRARGKPVLVGWRPALAAAAALIAVGGLALLRHSPQAELSPTVAQSPAIAQMPPSDSLDVASLSQETAAPEGARSVVAEDPAEAPAEPAPPAAEEVTPVAPRAVPVIHTVDIDSAPKGPAPAHVAPAVVPSGVALPAALGALRVVARSAARDVEVQREMELAGERFAVLNCEALSEATLVGMSGFGPEPASEDNGTIRTLPSLGPSAPDGMGEAGAASPASSTPAREGASLLPCPFV